MKKHFSIAVLGFISGLLVYLYLAFGRSPEEGEYRYLEGIFSGLFGISIAYLVWEVSQKLDVLIPWNDFPGTRLIAGLATMTFSSYLLVWATWSGYRLLPFAESVVFLDYRGVQIKLAILLFLIFLLFSVIYFGLYSYHFYARIQIEKLHLESQQLELQLKALKSQISPHFLFNSLSAVSTLIHRDVDLAEKFIRNLANTYSYILKSYNKKWVSLAEELSFVNSYKELLNARFDNNFDLSVELPDAIIRTNIPPLTLQMLIENAVKHNTMDSQNSLQVKIGYEANWLAVTNNRTESPKSVASFGIGLSNIRNRYEILSGKQIKIDNGDMFTVKLPVIQ